MKRFVLLLGGTGARIADALITAAASGVFPAETLEVLLVDTDRRGVRSAGLVAAKMEDYATIQAAMDAKGGPFSAKMNFAVWPSELPQQADSISQWTDDNGVDELLCQALFDQDAADIDLHEGFHGSRALGQVTFAGMLHEADQDPDDALCCLVDAMVIAAEDGEEVRCVVVGSVCGGTGAAGIPALCRYIRKRTGDQVHLGAILMGANTDEQDAAAANETISAYAREGLCETIGMLALPAACRTNAPVEYPQLTDWLSVYMMDVLLHRPEWLQGVFTVRAPEGAASWRMFGPSAERYRIAYGQLMKTAMAWEYALSKRVERGLRHPFILRDGLLGWYAHFFRRVRDREEQLYIMERLDRLMSVCLLWLGGVCKTLPIDLRQATPLMEARREAEAHYNELTELQSQLTIMDDAAQRTEDYANDLVHRHQTEEAEEAEQAVRRISAVKQEAARRRAAQAAHQRKMGGHEAIRMLEKALAQAENDLAELQERHAEAIRRIEHAETIAAAEDQYRIDDARVKLQRLERHERMLKSRVDHIREDLVAADASGLRFKKPELPSAPAENDMFLADVAERLITRDQLSRHLVEGVWHRLVRPAETATLREAMKHLRKAPVNHEQPLMSLLSALLSESMQPSARKEAKE